jgi:8-oxo-dGTP pyrophosphatase MutT (NUDIX family)
MFSFKEELKYRLSQPLPGMEAQYEMAPAVRGRFPVDLLKEGTYRKSAVMLMIYKKGNDLWIPLTKRHEYKGKHSGQISLPGGKFDEPDGNLENTALRELQEEIGINKEIEIIGSLTPLYIPVSNFLVQPFVSMYQTEDIEFNTNEREVKELIPLQIDLLKKPELIKKEGIVSGDGYHLNTPYFDLNGEVVWGATAMILNEFSKLLND